MKLQANDSDYDPENDELKFQEPTELEGQVKERISEIMQGRTTRPVIAIQDAVKYLRSKFGLKFTAILCSVEDKDLTAFGRTSRPKSPTPLQGRNIAAAYMIADILLSSVPKDVVQDWFTTYNDYLWGVPAIEISRRPEDVRMAALAFVAEGR